MGSLTKFFGAVRQKIIIFERNYFDQLLQTVKNKTTVLMLVFKEFTNINSTTDFCTLWKRVSRFSVEKISSHSTEKLCRGTLLCFTKFWYRKKFMDKRGHIKIFRRKFFCLTVPKNFVGESFSASLISSIEKC